MDREAVQSPEKSSLEFFGSHGYMRSGQAIHSGFVHEVKHAVVWPRRTLGMRIVGDARFVGVEKIHVLLWGVKHVAESNVDTIGRRHASCVFEYRIDILCARD